MLTTRPTLLPSGSNRFSRSWLFGAVAPRIFLLGFISVNGPKETYFVAVVVVDFNDVHVLQLWSETIAVRRRMIYGGN